MSTSIIKQNTSHKKLPPSDELSEVSGRILKLTLDALSSNIAILDEHGTIIYVNKSWRSFADSNGMTWENYGVGRNYVNVCLNAKEEWSNEALTAAKNIQEIIGHKKNMIRVEYPCHSPHKKRWFEMVVTRFDIDNSLYIVIKHEDITQRNLADQKLTESEYSYRNIIETCEEGVWIVDAEFKTTFVNKKMATMLGYKIKEMLGMPLLFYTDTEWTEKFHGFERQRTKGAYEQHEYRFLRKDGSHLWAHVSTNPIYNSNKCFAGTLAMVNDITVLKDMETMLRHTAEEWQETFDSMSDFISLHDNDFRFIRVNRALADYIGKKPDQLIGKHCYEFMHHTNAPPADCPHFEALKNKKAASREMVDSDAGRCFQVTVSPIYEDTDEFKRIVHVARDISDRKKTETALAESEEKYRMQLAEARDAIFLADAETGLILDCNPAAEKLTGRKRTELLGMHQKSLHPLEEYAVKFSSTFSRHLHDDEGKNLEAKVITKSGELIHVSIKANTFEFKGRKLMQGVFRDITEAKNAEALLITSEAALKQKKEALEQKNIALSEMMEQVNIEKNKIKEDIAIHIENTLMPIVSKMKLMEDTAQYKDLLLYHLNTMASSFGHKIIQKSSRLTSRELEICNMIKAGFSSKEICKLLNTSDLTVSKHRRNIRNKFGLSNKKINLWSFLNKL